MLTLASMVTAIAIAAAIVVVRRRRGHRRCSHPLRRARGRTCDRKRALGAVLASAVATTIAHDA